MSTTRHAIWLSAVVLALASSSAAQDRRIFIVHGTYDGTESWPRVVDGHASFASELQRACGGDVVPFLWRTSIEHDRRIEAARDLAKQIDAVAESARVAVVGFSHGGNVALEAVRHVNRPVDCVVCLATPHVYLTTRDEKGAGIHIPIYCTPDARKRIRRLVSVVCDTDDVVKVFSSLRNGVGDQQAVEATNEWRTQLNHPRLADDGSAFEELLEDLVGLKLPRNVAVSANLNVADHNLSISTRVQGTDVHRVSHCCRMGELLGELIAEKNVKCLSNLESLCLPADAGFGEPTKFFDYEKHRLSREDKRRFSGFVLRTLTIKSKSLFKPNGDHWDSDESRPDVYCKLCDGLPRESSIHTDVALVKTHPNWFVDADRKVKFEVWDGDLSSQVTFGLLNADDLMGSFEVQPKAGQYQFDHPQFHVELDWSAAHE